MLISSNYAAAQSKMPNFGAKVSVKAFKNIVKDIDKKAVQDFVSLLRPEKGYFNLKGFGSNATTITKLKYVKPEGQVIYPGISASLKTKIGNVSVRSKTISAAVDFEGASPMQQLKDIIDFREGINFFMASKKIFGSKRKLELFNDKATIERIAKQTKGISKDGLQFLKRILANDSTVYKNLPECLPGFDKMS